MKWLSLIPSLLGMIQMLRVGYNAWRDIDASDMENNGLFWLILAVIVYGVFK